MQGIGNIKINVHDIGIDALSLSAHKFYGPKGVGALYIKSEVDFERILDGGHQEKNKRAGTENVAEIVGLGKAIEIANRNIDEYNKKLIDLREYYITEVEKRISNVKLNGARYDRLSGNANFSFKGVEGENLLLKLDACGICASAGSACNSGEPEPSHVLIAIGTPKEYINSALRVTFGEENTKEDVDFLIDNLARIVEEVRKV